MGPKVSIVKADSYDPGKVYASVKKAVDLLGGISSFAGSGETILLKPNVLSAKPPESGVDTHPEMIRAVARLVKEAGAKVIVGDSPGGVYFKDAGSTYEAAGIKKVCDEEKIELVDFDRARNVRGMPITEWAFAVDGIISLPKMKTHGLTMITGAVKNSYGLAIGLYKAQCHFKAPRPEAFCKYVVDVFETAKPRLVIMDGITAMEGDGPAAGNLRDAGLVIAGNDCVAIDSVFAALIGIEPLKVGITAEAYRRGLGEADISKIEVVGETINAVKLKDFKLPKTSVVMKLPEPLLKLIIGGIKFLPRIDDNLCKGCLICEKSCPAAAIKIGKGRSRIDYSKCVRCFCCMELCPHKAIHIKRSLLARLIG